LTLEPRINGIAAVGRLPVLFHLDTSLGDHDGPPSSRVTRRLSQHLVAAGGKNGECGPESHVNANQEEELSPESSSGESLGTTDR
jgi:hypothetical protein